jgi:hypothetical protein
MSVERIFWTVLGLGLVVGLVVAFFAGFVMGRARGHVEGYHRAWGLMAGGDRR